jgi:hypothetical protein
MRYTRSMDFDTLHDMAASAARGADQMCGHEVGPGSQQSLHRLGGYPHYISQYNRLLKFAAELDPAVTAYCEPIELGSVPDPRGLTPAMWGIYAEQAAVALNSLASYLQSKLGKKQQEYEQIIDLIRWNLRPTIYQDPKHEREVQNALEIIFNVRNLDFRREKDTVPYSTTHYIPDFTLTTSSAKPAGTTAASSSCTTSASSGSSPSSPGTSRRTRVPGC